MKRTVYLENSLKKYLHDLRSDGFSAGLLLGQNSSEHDYIVHLARTPIPKDIPNLTNLKQVTDLQEEWVTDHIRNVIQMLPGGMTILGLFFVGEGNLFTTPASTNALKNILSSINSFLKDNQYYFIDSVSTSKLVLHFVNDSITCKRFSVSQPGNHFDAVECVSAVSSWHRITCYYDFERLLPLYVKTMSNTVLHDKFMDILKYVSESVKKSVLLFNGEIRNEKDLIKGVTEQSSKRTGQSTADTESNPQIMVDVYAPCEAQFSNTVCEVSEYVAELKCFGTLCSDVYLHENASVSEAIQAVKEDIIRSLYSRLTMHCNSLLEDLSSSAPDETKIIHEPPRRISVTLPYSTEVRFTDYLFPGEDSLSTLPAKEQLDIRDTCDEELLYEPLEAETDAAEFYTTDNVTNNVIDKLDTRKNHLRYVISIGVVLSIFVVIFAILFQKLRS